MEICPIYAKMQRDRRSQNTEFTLQREEYRQRRKAVKCAEYIRAHRSLLSQHTVKTSMPAPGNPYRNAIAERIDETVTQEYGLHCTFNSLVAASRALRKAGALYNYERMHTYSSPPNAARKSTKIAPTLNTLVTRHVQRGI